MKREGGERRTRGRDGGVETGIDGTTSINVNLTTDLRYKDSNSSVAGYAILLTAN